MPTVKIRRDSRAIEKPEHFAANILKTFAPKNFKFQLTEYTECHTGIVVNLPRNINRYYCSIAKQFIKINPTTNLYTLECLTVPLQKHLLSKKAIFLVFYCLIAKVNLL